MKEQAGMPEEELLSSLRQAEVFSPLSDTELQALAHHAQASWHDFGETILEAGATCEGMYLIASGTVRVFSSSDGKDRRHPARPLEDGD